MTATSRGAKPSSLTLHLQGAAISHFTLLVEITKGMYAMRSNMFIPSPCETPIPAPQKTMLYFKLRVLFIF